MDSQVSQHTQMETDGAPSAATLDIASIKVLDLLQFGEEMLASLMRAVSEVLSLGRLSGFPVDKQQLQMLTERLSNVPQTLKGVSGVIQRLRITEDLLNLAIPDDSQPLEELIVSPDESADSDLQDPERNLQLSVSKALWKEYMDLQDKLSKQDAYIKTIIDAERMFLQEVNCLLQP